ncbi:MAG TPA: DNRLRE domain-containing protein [Calditerricola sp.]
MRSYSRRIARRKAITYLVLFAFLFTTLFPPGMQVHAEGPSRSKPPEKLVKRELVAFRTETSKLIDNGDGTFTRQIFFVPIHRKKNGRWEEISTRLVRSEPNGTLAPENTALDARFTPRMVKGRYLTLRSGPHSLSYTLLGAEGEAGTARPADVTPTYEDNRIYHKGVFPGVDLRNIVLDTSVKEDLILTEYRGFHRFQFRIETTLRGQKEADGSVTFRTADGEVVFRLPKPFMSDSNIDPLSDEPQRSENVTYELEEQDGAWLLTIVADPAWLKDPARKYPVYIDPTTTRTTTHDTFVFSAYPTTNYEGFWESSQGYYSLKVGYYDSTTGTNYAYLKQDLSNLKNVIIDSAKLYVYCAHSYYVSTPTGVWVDRVTGSWTASTLTWNNKPGSTNITSTQVYRGQWAVFDVTGVVKAWVDGTSTNYGFKLHTNGNGQTYWKKFYASENSTNKPYLSITYRIPAPNAPTGVAYAHGDGNSGWVDLKWDPVPGATGYKVWIYNGIEYEAFDVGNVTQWTTRNKGIWPTPEEIAAGRYKLHHDGKGTELARDPSPVYRNSGGKYTTNKNYWFRVSAYQSLGESVLSEAFMPTIPDREDLGVESFWTYVPVPKGKVNAATGNLVLEDTDLEIPGRGPVVTIRRTYNSRSAEDGPFGLGWTFSLGMRIREDGSGNVFWTDEDGTVHRFTKNADGSYTPPPGIYDTLTKTGSGYTLKDKDQTQYLFDTAGKLTKVQDANGNALTLAYNASGQLTTITDASSRKTTLTYNADGKVATVTDPASRTWTYGYSGNLLVSVTDPEGGVTRYEYANNVLTAVYDPTHTDTRPVRTTFTYTDGKVTSVRDPLGRTTTLAYDAANRKTTVTDPRGKVTQYFYNLDANPVKVVVDPSGLNLVTTYVYDLNQLLEVKDPNANKAGDTQASESYAYDSRGNVTRVQDPAGTETFQYNANNDITRYTDATGQAYTYTYDGVNPVSGTDPVKVSDAKVYDNRGNLIAATKELGMADNRVTNPGMERVNSGLPESWTLVTSGDSGTMAADSGQKHSGARSVRLTSQSTTSGGGLGFVAAIQDIPVAPNTTYTLSGYIKTLNLNGANAFFNVYQLNANKQPVANPWTDNRYSQLSGTHDWTLRQLTFTTGPNTAYVRIYLEVDHRSDTASGTAWFDDIQLERGEVSTGYNPLENSSFEQQLNFWQNVSGSGGAGSIDATQAFDGARSLKMIRAAATDPALVYRQRIDLYQSTPEPITVSGMSKASGVQNTAAGGPNDDYAIWVEAVHSDGTSTSGGARFALGTHDWQRAAVTLHPTKPIQYVNVNVVFRGQNTGTVWFDNIRLQAGRAITTYEYDAGGNYVTKTTDPLGYSRQSTYDAVGNELSSTDARGNTRTFAYDQLGRMTSVVLPGYDVKAEYTYDKNGNVTERKLTSKDGATVYSRIRYEYDEANQLVAVTDPLGNVTRYSYDANGNVTQETNPDGSRQEYLYDAADRKTEIRFNGVVRYRFTYDANGNVTKVEDLALGQERTQTFDKVNRLIGMTTAGGTVAWTYDADDNVTAVTITSGSTTYTHSYEYNDADHNIRVTDPSGRVYRFNYDEAGNVRTVTQGNGTVATYIYDENDRVTHISIGKTTDGSPIAAYVYTYDENGNRTSVKDHTGKVIAYTYDALNQLISETDPTSDRTIFYTYDARGNRTSKVVKDAAGNVVERTDYTYNTANQLVAVNGQPLVYDANGNLVDDGERVYVWDAAGHLVIVKRKADGSVIAQYAYDEQGRRVRSVAGGSSHNV